MAKRRQEAALRALLTAPTIKEAAESSGIGQSTLFRYLQNNEFRKRYQEAKRFLLDQALSDLQRAAKVVNAQPHPEGGYAVLAVIQIGSREAGLVRFGRADGPELVFAELPYAVAGGDSSAEG